MKNASVKRIFPLLAALCLLFTTFIGAAMKPVSTYAAEDLQAAYEQRNVLDDLRGMTIGGETFDPSEYPPSTQGDPTVISFVEFGFPFDQKNRYDYGLYLYVYNPRQLAFDANEAKNTIQMSVGHNAEEHKYGLRELNHSTEPGKEFVFYKFKLILTLTDTNKIFNALNADTREYRLTDLELTVDGTVIKSLQKIGNKEGMKVRYSGYATGYGDPMGENPALTCTVDGLDRLITLDVHHTYYRAGGDFYKGEQSQINSVFFRIPNKYLNDYGDLSAVLCEWYEYLTKPFVVTNDMEAADYLERYCSTYLSNSDRFLAASYAFGGDPTLCAIKYKTEDLNAGSWFNSHKTKSEYFLNYVYDDAYKDYGDLQNSAANSAYKKFLTYQTDEFFEKDIFCNEIEDLAGVFFSTAADITSSGQMISSYALKQKLLQTSKGHYRPITPEGFPSDYSPDLFEDFAYPGNEIGFRHEEIVPDQDFTLNFNTMKAREWWQKIFTGGYDMTTRTERLRAFEFITKNDFNGNNEQEIADKLFIDKYDVKLLQDEVDRAEKNDETVVLMRFASSTYFSFPGAIGTTPFVQPTLGDTENDRGASMINEVTRAYNDEKWNCFVFQETVYLNFDVLSFTFTRSGINTVIPVSATPQDVINAGTAPLEPGNEGEDNLLWILWVVLAVIAFILLLIFIPGFANLLLQVVVWIGKGIVWLVSLPFKGIAALIESIKDSKEKRKKDKADKERIRAEKDAEDRERRDYEERKRKAAENERREKREIAEKKRRDAEKERHEKRVIAEKKRADADTARREKREIAEKKRSISTKKRAAKRKATSAAIEKKAQKPAKQQARQSTGKGKGRAKAGKSAKKGKKT